MDSELIFIMYMIGAPLVILPSLLFIGKFLRNKYGSKQIFAPLLTVSVISLITVHLSIVYFVGELHLNIISLEKDIFGL